MKIKVSEATPIQLDYLVSKADTPPGRDGWGWFKRDAQGFLFDPLNECRYSPSTDWNQGGPIIERERIQLLPSITSETWNAVCPYHNNCIQVTGPTPLIAAMRCYVTYKLGDEVEIPLVVESVEDDGPELE